MGVTAMSQGALFSMANVACRENAKTNIRFNEHYLAARVDYDSVAEEAGDGRMKASELAKSYEGILANEDINACRVSVMGRGDLEQLKYKKKLANL
jgi:hypothetical protein